MMNEARTFITQSICDDLCQMDINLTDLEGKKIEGSKGYDLVSLLVETALDGLYNFGLEIVKKETRR